MADLEKLRADYEKAEQKAQKIMSDKDEALQKVRDRFTDKLQKANDEAAEAQKALNDAEALAALAARDDAVSTARVMVSRGDFTPDQIESVGINLDDQE